MGIVQNVFEELAIDFERPTAGQLELLVQRLLHETKRGLSKEDHTKLENDLTRLLSEIK
jgi:hypothetical protein